MSIRMWIGTLTRLQQPQSTPDAQLGASTVEGVTYVSPPLRTPKLYERQQLMKRVQRGAAWLDVRHPGWFARIKVDRLNLSCCGKCVLGQLYGNYNVIERYMKVSEPDVDTIRYGFTIPSQRWSDANWAELSSCWREEIARRNGWSESSQSVDAVARPVGDSTT